jgi:hypothetical protein
MRTFDPNTGRYTASDPIGLRGGTNTYSYVLSSPLMSSDPTGLLSRGSGLSDQLWDEVQKAERRIRREFSRSCSCNATGPESCIPCESLPDLLNSLETTFIHGATIPGICGRAGVLSRYVQLTPSALDPTKCPCVAATLYHELLHTIGWGHTGADGSDPATERDLKCRGNLCK